MPPVSQTIPILDSRNPYEFLRLFNLRRCYSLNPMWRILPCCCISSARQALFERRARVDSMQLVEVDAVQFEPAQAHFHTLDEVGRRGHWLGACRAGRVFPPLVAMTTPGA